jgi:hypothetical protein
MVGYMAAFSQCECCESKVRTSEDRRTGVRCRSQPIKSLRLFRGHRRQALASASSVRAILKRNRRNWDCARLGNSRGWPAMLRALDRGSWDEVVIIRTPGLAENAARAPEGMDYSDVSD